MGRMYSKEKIREFPQKVHLDKEKDIALIINIDEQNGITYEIQIDKSLSDKLLKNIARLLNTTVDKESGTVTGEFFKDENAQNEYNVGIKNFRSINIDLENQTISYPKIPKILKVLMSQKDNLEFQHLEYYDEEIKTDLHSHYTAMLEPEKLIALGLKHELKYPASHIFALDLDISEEQLKVIEDSILKNNENGEELLSEIRNNKGNWKAISQLFIKNQIKAKPIPLKEIIIGEPSEQKSNNLKKIMDSCVLPKENQNTFTDMKETYMNRDPFTNSWKKGSISKESIADIMNSDSISDDIKATFQKMLDDLDEKSEFKDNNLQEDMMLWIARNAREEGIDYIEMSHNALMTEKNQDYLNTYEKILEKIEKETDTQLRFLIGISRTTKTAKFNDNRENIKKSLTSKYVVGIDILGEETNSTQNFEGILAEMTRYALNVDPDMVIRVHAGETNSFDSNISKTVEIVYREYLHKLEQSSKPEDEKKPNLRIGHGIHGLEEELQTIDKTSPIGEVIEELKKYDIFKSGKDLKDEMNLLDFMAEMDTVIIERCMTSNTLLSHQSVPGKDPLKQYIRKGVKCVLGTDGYGVYGTSSQEELGFSTTSGIDNKDIKEIQKSEEYAFSRNKERERWIQTEKAQELIHDYHIGKIEEQTKQSNKDNGNYETVKIQEHFSESEKNAIVVSGGSFNKYDATNNYKHSTMLEQDEEILRKLVYTVDPLQNEFIIGCRLEAQERRLVELINERNSILPDNEKINIIMVTQSFENLPKDSKYVIRQSNIVVVESGQKEEFETYKKLESEIFLADRKADLLVFDGYQQAENLVTDANKGKNNRILFGREKINEYLDDKRKVTDDIKVMNTEERVEKYYGKNALNDCMDDDKSRISQEQHSTAVVKRIVDPTITNDKKIESR